MSFFDSKRDLVNLPPKIRCDVGNEWKTPDHFSKNKLRQFISNKRRTNATAANSGIACRVHSGEPETMLKCDGPCGKIYGLEHFSRNTRIRGIYWCNDCTDWQGKNEPGFMPYPIPFAPRSEENRNKDETAHEALTKGENIRNMDLEDDLSSIAPSCATTEREHSVVMSADHTGSLASSAAPTAEGSIYSDDSYHGSALPNVGPRQFNAWGPDGVMHRVTKAPTVVSAASTSASRSNVTATQSGWAKPSMRKTPADAPDYIKFGRCNPTFDDDYHSADGLSDDEI